MFADHLALEIERAMIQVEHPGDTLTFNSQPHPQPPRNPTGDGDYV
jgi:hypothetical protein